jgi:hypothetical protein
MTRFSQVAMFVSSYSPLFLVLAARGSFGDSWLAAAGPCAVAIVSWLVLWLVWRSVRAGQVEELRVEGVRRRDADAIGYVATYLVPSAVSNLDHWRESLAVVLFVALLGILFVRSNLFYVNPVLAILGYRTYDATVTTGDGVVREYVVLSKTAGLRPGVLRVNRMSTEVWIERQAGSTR